MGFWKDIKGGADMTQQYQRPFKIKNREELYFPVPTMQLISISKERGNITSTVFMVFFLVPIIVVNGGGEGNQKM